MTTKEIAGSAVERMLTGKRRAVRPAVTGMFNWKWGKIASWGVGKHGKTHLGLSARSSAIWEVKRSGFKAERGALLLPSRPLSIAYANFDRPVDTVVDNLESDVQIVEERLYLDKHDELLIPITMLIPDFQQLFERFRQFVRDSLEAEAELIVLDGGTIVWEDIRRWKGIPPEAGVLPKEYQESNSEMRWRVMSLLEELPVHVYITREAKEKWASASGPQLDPYGNPMMEDDGWNKTSHRVDMDVQLRLVQTQSGLQRRAVVHTALRPQLLGRSILDPTFAGLYQANYGNPLIRKEDLEEYLRIVKDVEFVEAEPVRFE